MPTSGGGRKRRRGREEPTEVVFHQRLRDEVRFDSVEALIQQITLDVETARAWHEKHPQEGLHPLFVGV